MGRGETGALILKLVFFSSCSVWGRRKRNPKGSIKKLCVCMLLLCCGPVQCSGEDQSTCVCSLSLQQSFHKYTPLWFFIGVKKVFIIRTYALFHEGCKTKLNLPWSGIAKRYCKLDLVPGVKKWNSFSVFVFYFTWWWQVGKTEDLCLFRVLPQLLLLGSYLWHWFSFDLFLLRSLLNLKTVQII